MAPVDQALAFFLGFAGNSREKFPDRLANHGRAVTALPRASSEAINALKYGLFHRYCNSLHNMNLIELPTAVKRPYFSRLYFFSTSFSFSWGMAITVWPS